MSAVEQLFEEIAEEWRPIPCWEQFYEVSSGGRVRHNSLMVKGVSFRRGYFVARIQCDGRRREIGYYRTLDEAIAAYDNAAKALHGSFARTNHAA